MNNGNKLQNSDELIQTILNNESLTIGYTLTCVRNILGLSRRAAAKGMGLSVTGIKMVERENTDEEGVFPRYATYKKAIDFYNIDEKKFHEIIFRTPKLAVSMWEDLWKGKPHTHVGGLLRLLRMEQNLTAVRVGELMGMQQANVTRMETSKAFISIAKITQYLDVLGIEFEDFYFKLLECTKAESKLCKTLNAVEK